LHAGGHGALLNPNNAFNLHNTPTKKKCLKPCYNCNCNFNAMGALRFTLKKYCQFVHCINLFYLLACLLLMQYLTRDQKNEEKGKKWLLYAHTHTEAY
jgi:hypothetical protein